MIQFNTHFIDVGKNELWLPRFQINLSSQLLIHLNYQTPWSVETLLHAVDSPVCVYVWLFISQFPSSVMINTGIPKALLSMNALGKVCKHPRKFSIFTIRSFKCFDCRTLCSILAESPLEAKI